MPAPILSTSARRPSVTSASGLARSAGRRGGPMTDFWAIVRGIWKARGGALPAQDGTRAQMEHWRVLARPLLAHLAGESRVARAIALANAAGLCDAADALRYRGAAELDALAKESRAALADHRTTDGSIPENGAAADHRPSADLIEARPAAPGGAGRCPARPHPRGRRRSPPRQGREGAAWRLSGPLTWPWSASRGRPLARAFWEAHRACAPSQAIGDQMLRSDQ